MRGANVATPSIQSATADQEDSLSDEGFWIAVRPFKVGGDDPDLTALADGISDEIVTGLSCFSYLRVVAPGSETRDPRYLIEGSFRKAGTQLRLAVHLVDVTTGTHLWAETYKRAFLPEAVFELQDDLVPRIVSTVADMHGFLPRSMGEALRSRAPEQLSPYQAVLRSFGYFTRLTAEELAAARTALELAVQKAPAYADAWAMLALLCAQEHGQGFNLLPDSLAVGADAARRAVETGPSNHLAHFSLAQVLFFKKEFEAFRNAAERAAALNPMDGNSIAFLGELLTYAGDVERGLELAERAKQLNPHHPGWYWMPDFYHAYSQGDYSAALAAALKMNLPGHLGMHTFVAACNGQLGKQETAATALRSALELRPDFAEIARSIFVKWWNPEHVEHLIEGLRKAGIEIPPAPGSEESSVGDPSRGPGSGATSADEGFWVAVLPFKYTGGNADLNALAEGLSEEIVTGLSRFSYLRVIARSSTERYLGGAVDVRSVGTELAARYVMEGSIRQAGSTLRISAQLVDTSSGAHIWAETYERPFSTDAIFELQDDLVPRIVSTVADWYGILPHSMSEAVRSKPVDQLTPYEALLRGFGYFERVTPEEHAVARPILERAVEEAPGHAAAWAMLSMLYGEEHRFGFNMEPDPLDRSLQAARRAIETAPSSHASHLALAQAHYFRKDFDAFRNAAERAVALNPMDGATVEYLGHLLAFAGDWERGCELGERARQLNPHHPAWYWALPLLDAYRKGDYLDARALVPKALMPGQYYSHALFAALYGQLGEREAAVEATRELLALRPDFAQIARDQFEKWYLPQLVEQLIDGLGKAGLEIPPASDSDVSLAGADESPGPASGASRADEGFWIAVLPFKYRGSDPDVETLAEGLADEVVSGLSRFSFLRVIASSSTAKYAGETTEAGTVGRELGARYVIEGTIRQAGSILRVSAQLVDTDTGAHLWAETYERPFRPEEVFELQDDLVPRIVSTVGDAHGILPHTMSELLRGKKPDQLTPYEAVLRSFGYGYRRTPEEHAAVRDALERAVEQAPRYADALAMLALVYADEHSHGYNLQPDPIGRALQAARRAAEAAPSNAMALNALAWAMFFSKEVQAFRTAAEQSIALNPLNGPTLAGLGALTSYSGDWERGSALVERALDLNPRHPGWYWFPLFYKAYREEDYRGAVNIALKINLPAFFVTHEALAAAYGQLGESDAASKSLREMLRLKPDYAETGRERLEKWFDSEFVEHLTDGLRKAGLDVPATGEIS